MAKLDSLSFDEYFNLITASTYIDQGYTPENFNESGSFGTVSIFKKDLMFYAVKRSKLYPTDEEYSETICKPILLYSDSYIPTLSDFQFIPRFFNLPNQIAVIDSYLFKILKIRENMRISIERSDIFSEILYSQLFRIFRDLRISPHFCYVYNVFVQPKHLCVYHKMEDSGYPLVDFLETYAEKLSEFNIHILIFKILYSVYVQKLYFGVENVDLRAENVTVHFEKNILHNNFTTCNIYKVSEFEIKIPQDGIYPIIIDYGYCRSFMFNIHDVYVAKDDLTAILFIDSISEYVDYVNFEFYEKYIDRATNEFNYMQYFSDSRYDIDIPVASKIYDSTIYIDANSELLRVLNNLAGTDKHNIDYTAVDEYATKDIYCSEYDELTDIQNDDPNDADDESGNIDTVNTDNFDAANAISELQM
jgi:hypothetical protein